MNRPILSNTFRRWIEYLAAILIGNAIYYLSLFHHLPLAFQHQNYRIDWGMVLDFAVCLAVYGLIWVGSRL